MKNTPAGFGINHDKFIKSKLQKVRYMAIPLHA